MAALATGDNKTKTTLRIRVSDLAALLGLHPYQNKHITLVSSMMSSKWIKEKYKPIHHILKSANLTHVDFQNKEITKEAIQLKIDQAVETKKISMGEAKKIKCQELANQLQGQKTEHEVISAFGLIESNVRLYSKVFSDDQAKIELIGKVDGWLDKQLYEIKCRTKAFASLSASPPSYDLIQCLGYLALLDESQITLFEVDIYSQTREFIVKFDGTKWSDYQAQLLHTTRRAFKLVSLPKLMEIYTLGVEKQDWQMGQCATSHDTPSPSISMTKKHQKKNNNIVDFRRNSTERTHAPYLITNRQSTTQTSESPTTISHHQQFRVVIINPVDLGQNRQPPNAIFVKPALTMDQIQSKLAELSIPLNSDRSVFLSGREQDGGTISPKVTERGTEPNTDKTDLVSSNVFSRSSSPPMPLSRHIQPLT